MALDLLFLHFVGRALVAVRRLKIRVLRQRRPLPLNAELLRCILGERQDLCLERDLPRLAVELLHDLRNVGRLGRRAVEQHGVRRTVDEDAARCASLLPIRSLIPRGTPQRQFSRARKICWIRVTHGIDMHAPQAIRPLHRRQEIRRAFLDEHESFRCGNHAQELRWLLRHMKRYRPRDAVVEHDVLVRSTRQRQQHRAHIAFDDLHLNRRCLRPAAAQQQSTEQDGLPSSFPTVHRLASFSPSTSFLLLFSLNLCV